MRASLNFVFISLVVLLLRDITYATNNTKDISATNPALTSSTTIPTMMTNQPPTTMVNQAPKIQEEADEKVDPSKSHECPITAKLYDLALATRGNGKKRNCTEPGCFFIYEQENLGWEFPAFLIENKKRGRLLYLAGCRYDIPLLLERTVGIERIHRALRALRACYIGERVEAEKAYFCQPEYKENGTNFALNQGMEHSIREDGERDTWVGRFLPSTQNRCFNNFIEGMFYVNDDGNSILVCCSNGNEDKMFKQICHDTSSDINKLKWRDQIDD
uniref:Uncharacterized protein n=1 Tax=Meloidogyne enterolobii TaxID=390850 RepID=A0A6V7TL33_MELEN|nr:unnamed protein product [Meloidogyne enterolobii]